MESHTMASQAAADAKHRVFKRDVNYRSLRSQTSKALSTIRKKVSELSQRRPLEPLNESPASASLKQPRRMPAPPRKRSPSLSLSRSPPEGQEHLEQRQQQLRTPAAADNSAFSDFGDSPALFQYKDESPKLPRRISNLIRRSVRLRRLTETTPPSAKRLLSTRASKAIARRRIEQIQSPARRQPRPNSPCLLAELNSIASGIAALHTTAENVLQSQHGHPQTPHR